MTPEEKLASGNWYIDRLTLPSSPVYILSAVIPCGKKLHVDPRWLNITLVDIPNPKTPPAEPRAEEGGGV